VKSSSTLLRAAAVAAATAIVAGSVLLVGGTASAAEVQVSGSEIAPNESTYVGWHEGYASPGAPATVTDAGLTLTGKSQIINGLATPLTGVTFESLAATTGTTVVAGGNKYSYQLPIFADPGTAFTTVRTLANGWTLTGGIGGSTEGVEYTAAQIGGFLGSDFSVLAFGVQVQSETTTFATISFQGTTYRFNKVVPPVAPGVTITPTTITPADFVDTTKGFTVNIVGFQPNEEVTVGLTLPDGKVVGFANGGNVFAVGADGSLVLPNLVLTGSGSPQLGVYTFTVTGTTTAAQTATITVANAAVVANDPQPQPKAKLANTGISDAPLFVSAGVGMLLMGLAAFGITVARRRTA
jgi:hypothetical protein